MLGKVSFHQAFEKPRGYILDAFSRTEALQEKVSTGKSINRPSDDPLGLVQSHNYKTGIARSDMYIRNMDDAKAWMDTTENVMNSAMDTVQNIRALTVKLADEINYTTDDRDRLTAIVNTALDELVAKSNTRLAGRFIFSGYRTFTQSYTTTTNPAGEITAVAYGGDASRIRREIADNHEITVNLSGQEAFQAAFDELIRLRADLRNPAVRPDSAPVGSLSLTQHLSALDEVIKDMDTKRAGIGERVAMMDRLRTQTETTLSNLKDFMAQKEDADMPSVILQMNAAQNLYNASINVAGRVLQESLMNFLR